MSSELLKAQSNFISTEYIYSTFQNLSNISLVREFLQENKFGCFISALLIKHPYLFSCTNSSEMLIKFRNVLCMHSVEMQCDCAFRSSELINCNVM